MQNSALVSVIIPAWQAGKFIQQTIQSVLNQSWQNLEILVVDNGSDDDTDKVVQSVQDQRVKYFNTGKNLGASAARNYGLQQASGQYIQYLDADDILSPDKIKLQLSAIQDKPGYIAFGDVCFFTDAQNPFEQKPEPNEMFYFSSSSPLDFMINLYGGNGRAGMITIHSWLCPADILAKAGLWNEQISVDDDGEYFCRVMLASAGIEYVPNTHVYYRKHLHRRSLSQEQNRKAILSSVYSTELKLRACTEYSGNSEAVRKVFAKHFMELADISWPAFPDISDTALRKVKELGGTSHIPHMGNPVLNKLKYIFGWRTMKWISWKKKQLLG